eukprot:5261981-Amphidinium_carterae.1
MTWRDNSLAKLIVELAASNQANGGRPANWNRRRSPSQTSNMPRNGHLFGTVATCGFYNFGYRTCRVLCLQMRSWRSSWPKPSTQLTGCGHWQQLYALAWLPASRKCDWKKKLLGSVCALIRNHPALAGPTVDVLNCKMSFLLDLPLHRSLPRSRSTGVFSSPQLDLNPQSPAPEADVFSTRPGRLPPYARANYPSTTHKIPLNQHLDFERVTPTPAPNTKCPRHFFQAST